MLFPRYLFLIVFSILVFICNPAQAKCMDCFYRCNSEQKNWDSSKATDCGSGCSISGQTDPAYWRVGCCDGTGCCSSLGQTGGCGCDGQTHNAASGTCYVRNPSLTSGDRIGRFPCYYNNANYNKKARGAPLFCKLGHIPKIVDGLPETNPYLDPNGYYNRGATKEELQEKWGTGWNCKAHNLPRIFDPGCGLNETSSASDVKNVGVNCPQENTYGIACAPCQAGKYQDKPYFTVEPTEGNINKMQKSVQLLSSWQCKSQPDLFCTAGQFLTSPDVSNYWKYNYAGYRNGYYVREGKTFKNAKRIQCSSCPDNTYQNATSHKSPTCTEQPFCGQGQKVSEYQEMFEWTCIPCGENHYQPSPKHRSPTCLPQPVCGINEYLSAPRLIEESACLKCPPGTNQPLYTKHRNTTCQDTTTTTKSTTTTTTTVTSSTTTTLGFNRECDMTHDLCGIGLECREVGIKVLCRTKLCLDGEYVSEIGNCSPCPLGTISTDSQRQCLECTKATAGFQKSQASVALASNCLRRRPNWALSARWGHTLKTLAMC